MKLKTTLRQASCPVGKWWLSKTNASHCKYPWKIANHVIRFSSYINLKPWYPCIYQ
jgi:hypothetical protein